MKSAAEAEDWTSRVISSNVRPSIDQSDEGPAEI
jgi:hypothetical protein